jgi:hypothetical protein
MAFRLLANRSATWAKWDEDLLALTAGKYRSVLCPRTSEGDRFFVVPPVGIDGLGATCRNLFPVSLSPEEARHQWTRYWLWSPFRSVA